MRYFSMFTGVGGFEIGIEKAFKECSRGTSGLQSRGISSSSEGDARESDKDKPICIGFSEIDKYSCQVLKYGFPGVKNYGDATKINPVGLPDFDMLCGGFPCQAFSIAGKRLGFEDTRGTLFFEIARIAKSKQPKFIFLENVKGLLSHDNGRTFITILATLDELGYDAEWEVLNSKNFGVPQNRERVFIVGHLRGQCSQQVFPIGQGSKAFDKSREFQEQVASTLTTAQAKIGRGMDMIELTQNQSQGSRVYAIDGIATSITSKGGGPGGKTGLYDVSHVQSAHCLNLGMQGRRFKGDNEESFTLNTLGEIGVKLNNTIRRLTPVECERLQAFPDGWTKFGVNDKGCVVEMSDSQRYKMMGNAVTTSVIQVIAKRIILSEVKGR